MSSFFYPICIKIAKDPYSSMQAFICSNDLPAQITPLLFLKSTLQQAAGNPPGNV